MDVYPDFRHGSHMTRTRRRYGAQEACALGAENPAYVCMRRLLLYFLAGASLISFADDRPNILFIMTDDHAAQAISAYASKVNLTPNMDRLAKEGALLENCFVTNSICTPSRATLITGKYSHKNGVPVFNRFDSTQPNVAKMMQKAGYYTAMLGKWHLGSDPTGFDDWEILPGQGAYFDPVLYTADGQKKYKGDYVTHVITERTIDLLEHRPKDKPFLIFSHHKAPHRIWEPEAKYVEEFAHKSFPEPETLWDDYSTRTDALHENRQTIAYDLNRRDLKIPLPDGVKPGSPEARDWFSETPQELEIEVDGVKKKLSGKELVQWKYQKYLQDYLACVQSVDDSIGQVLDWLKANDLDQNTIVIYTSDNGFYLGEHGLFDKRFMYEESLRIPFLVRWPAGIKPGTKIPQLVINTDFAPTFLNAAGVATPDDMQGRSILPLLKGEVPADWRSSFYYRYYHDPGHHNTARHLGVRTETHKLIYFWKKDQWELFDLKADPNELNNLYGQQGQEEVTKQLKELIAKYKVELEDHDEFAEEFPTTTVDGPVEKLRGK